MHGPLVSLLLDFYCLQVRAWPGEQFTIELTGEDQFSQPTIANARFHFNNPVLVNNVKNMGTQL